MDKKTCPECGIENEEQYLYCKNCGASLTPKSEPETPPQNTNQSANYSSNYSASQNNFYSDDSYIDGIPEIEYQLYIGQKHNKFIPKFKAMEFTGSKYSWCWAPAILGFLGGPLWAAIWFFYRKIYKPAWILVAIGTVLSIITGLLTMNTTDAYYNAFMDSISSGDLNLFFNTVMNSSETLPFMISNTISDVSSFGTALFAGLYSHVIYKNQIKKKIIEYKTMHSDPQHYRLGLTYIGGTSGGMLTVGILLIIGSDTLVSIITKVLSMLL